MGAFSSQAWRDYVNTSSNPAPTEFRQAFRTDAIKYMDKAGWPSKDEQDILNTIEPDVSNTVNAIPSVISNFMADEDRSFNLPAPNDNTAPATIKIVHRDEKTKTGTIMFGENKGSKYTSTTKEHDEMTAKSNTSKFKE